MNPPEICPHCGADVPPRARACPECGADEETGWSEKAAADRLGIHDPDDFSYEEFAREEFDLQSPVKPRGMKWLWWAVAVGLLVITLLAFLKSFI